MGLCGHFNMLAQIERKYQASQLAGIPIGIIFKMKIEVSTHTHLLSSYSMAIHVIIKLCKELGIKNRVTALTTCG